MHQIILALGLFFLVAPAMADEGDFDFKNQEASRALENYRKKLSEEQQIQRRAIEILKNETKASETKWRKEIIAKLEVIRTKLRKDADLSEANKINDAIKALKKASPAGGSAADSKGKKSKARIPRDAVEYKGHHYKLFDIQGPHGLAMKKAESMGGHLVRIQGPDEQQVVAKLANSGRLSNYWIDGSDELNEGRWLFSDDKPIRFFYWDGGRASNSDWNSPVTGGIEHHIELRRDRGWKWNDMPNSVRVNGFICEWDSPDEKQAPIATARGKPKPAVQSQAKPERKSGLLFQGNGFVQTSLYYRGVTPITLEATVRPSLNITGNASIVGNTESSGGELKKLPNGHWAFIVHDGKAYKMAQSKNPIQPGKRVTLAGVFDGSTVKLFVDGVLQSSVPITAQKTSKYPFMVGANPDGKKGGGQHNFSGVIEEVKISAEALYDESYHPADGFETGKKTILLLKLDEGKGNIARDASKDKHHCRIHNAEWTVVDQPAVDKSVKEDTDALRTEVKQAVDSQLKKNQ